MDAIRLGRSVRVLRQRRGWRQVDLAQAAGVSRALVSNIERGDVDGVTLQTLGRVATAVESRLDCRLSWRGDGLDRLLDAAHASAVEEVARQLTRRGWEVAIEVTFAHYGERGAIDVLACRGASAVLVVEVKTSIADVQATLSTLDRKVRLAPEIGRSRGWRAAVVGRLLVVVDGRTTRRRVAHHERTFAAALPARSWAVKAWLDDPHGPFAGLWFLPNVTQPGVRRQRVRPRKAPGAVPRSDGIGRSGGFHPR